MGNIGFQEILLIVAVVIIVAYIYFIIALRDALKIISPENRRMLPINVWLLCIPFLNIVWIFFVVEALGTSFKREYEKYGRFSDTKPTYGIGIAMAILEICSFVFGIAGIAAIICWIAYWAKINQCKNDIITLRQNTVLPEGEKSIFHNPYKQQTPPTGRVHQNNFCYTTVYPSHLLQSPSTPVYGRG